MTASTSAEGATQYFDAALGQSDYYVRQQGILHGGRLEINGDITKDQFVDLVNNRVPGTKERWTPRTNGKRKELIWETDPETKERRQVLKEVENRRAGYDLTFSVPKSVSLYLAMTEDLAVERMCRDAVHETMANVETLAAVRVRKDGAEHDRVTGNLVWAEFIHRESRPVNGISDPHWHTHAYCFNGSYDDQEGRWKALQLGQIKEQAPLFEAEFHGRLAEKLREAGHGIRRTGYSFEMEAFSRAEIEAFSKRTKQIEDRAKLENKKLFARAHYLANESGMDFSDAYAVVKGEVGARNREKKAAARFTTEEAKVANWRAQFGPERWDQITPERSKSLACKHLLGADEAKRLAVDDFFTDKSRGRESDVIAAVLRYGAGVISREEAERHVKEGARFVRFADKPGLVTTVEVTREETHAYQIAIDGWDKHDPLGRGRAWAFQDEKVASSSEQAGAVRHTLECRDLVTSIRGPSGAGKSTLIKETVTALEALSAKRVMIFTPTSESAAELRKSGLERTDTFQQLMISSKLQQEARGCILMVDETGLLGAAQGHWLMRFTRDNQCRAILYGDRNQQRSVSRGDFLRGMEENHIVRSAELTTIYRQREVPELLAAVQDFSLKRAEEGFQKLIDIGVFVEREDADEHLKEIVERRREGLGQGKGQLIISPLHRDCRAIANAIRADEKRLGRIGQEDVMVDRLQSLNLKPAQQRDAMHYQEGQVVAFHLQATGGFVSGQQWRVSRVDAERGRVRVERAGRERFLPLAESERFTLCRREHMPLSVGERVRATKVMKAHGIRNNDLLKVKAIDDQFITLEGGRKLSRAEPLFIDQGYALTTVPAQGKQNHETQVYLPTHALNMIDMEAFYVSISRATHLTTVRTDCMPALREATLRSGARGSVFEMAKGENEVVRDRAGIERVIARMDAAMEYDREKKVKAAKHQHQAPEWHPGINTPGREQGRGYERSL